MAQIPEDHNLERRRDIKIKRLKVLKKMPNTLCACIASTTRFVIRVLVGVIEEMNGGLQTNSWAACNGWDAGAF